MTHHAFHPGFKADVPYMLLTVDLAEGVRMNAQARGIDVASLRVGLPVVVRVRHGKGRSDTAGVRGGGERIGAISRAPGWHSGSAETA